VLPPDSAYARSLAAAEQALAIAPNFAPALAARANVRMNFAWDWDGAERDFRQAIEVAPGLIEAREWLASLLMARGRRAEAIEMLHAAEQNSGGSPLLFTNLAQYHYFAGDHAAAHANIARALELDPLFSRAHVLRALVLCQQGRIDEAVLTLEALAPYRESDPLIAALLGYAYGRADRTNEALAQAQWLESRRRERYVPAEYLATVHLGLQHWDSALDHLEAAFANRSTGMLYLRHDPMLTPIREHPRLQALIAYVHRQ
jgi:tetratricopeptide (TPR) repeat protein